MSGDRFESLIAEGVDRIALPPESEWLPDPSRAAPRHLRPIRWVFVPLVAAVIVLAAALGAGLRTVREQSPATQPPAAAVPVVLPTEAPSATPAVTASPAPTLAPTDQYGLVVTDSQGEGRITVRRERNPAPVFELKGVAPVVSVDGKRLAYWRSAPNSGGLMNGTELRVVEVADPATDRGVFTPPADMFGGLLVWSNDGLGLLVVIDSRARSVGGTESCAVQSELLMLDLAAAAPSTRSAGTAACRTLVPLAWDRPGQAAAAIVTGPGGYATEYLTWSGTATNPFAKMNVPTDTGAPGVRTLLLAFSVWASPDAKLVMGLESSRDVLRVWPLLDITKADLVRSALPVSTATWRPGTGATGPYEVIWALGQRVELFRYKTDSVRTLYSSPLSLGIAAVRPDGSGVLIEEFTPGQPPPPTPRLLVVDIATRLATDLGTNVGGLRSLTRGVLLR